MVQRAIEIRMAGASDAAAMMPLMERFNAGERIPWRPDEMGAALRRLLREPALGLGLVAIDIPTQAAVGYGLAAYGYDIEFAGTDAFVTELFVTEDARAQGIGRRLLDALVASLRERDVKAVHLVVRPENERARTLYASMGFREVPRLLMTKPLADG